MFFNLILFFSAPAFIAPRIYLGWKKKNTTKTKRHLLILRIKPSVDIDKLAFTGSVATGSRVAEAGAKTVKNVSLELGGKSPIIVFDDVDIDQVVDWIMLGIFFNSGQVCSATSRLLVHKNIKDKLLEQLVRQSKKIHVGDGLSESTLMGPIINEAQHRKVLDYIQQGIKEGSLEMSFCSLRRVFLLTRPANDCNRFVLFLVCVFFFFFFFGQAPRCSAAANQRATRSSKAILCYPPFWTTWHPRPPYGRKKFLVQC